MQEEAASVGDDFPTVGDLMTTDDGYGEIDQRRHTEAIKKYLSEGSFFRKIIDNFGGK